ncbi:MAG: SBBP repeat-containing protein [Candidatus Korobacteraceae bacterium]
MNTRVADAYGKLPLAFEADQGQTDPQVKFVARGGGYTLFLTDAQAVLTLGTAQPNKQNKPRLNEAVVRMKLLGANPKSIATGLDELPGRSNYFIGNDPKKWATDVPNYARVKYQNIYPGIDLVYYGNQGQLECDFLLTPGSDPKTITLKVDPEPAGKTRSGEVPLQITRNGDLVVGLNGQEIRFHQPVAYQDVPVKTSQSKSERKFINARYVLEAKNQVGIRLSAYDATRPLVIDPVIWYSTHLGGSSTDQAAAIAVDSAGNVYVAGYTQSVDFPKVNQISGACQAGCGSGNDDAFVTKISASGKLLLYSSYLGGSGGDSVSSIAVDRAGNAYLTGGGNSSDFPRVNQIPGACVGSCGTGSNNDAFVTKINAAGNALVYSSLIGGSGDEDDDGFAGIAVDSAGNAYLTGNTFSTDFPRVNQIPGACNGSCGSGSIDVFVTKVNAAGNALVYSSLIGGSGTDIGFGIAVDSAGSAYLTGLIGSSDFPRVHQIPGACNGSCGAGINYDIYVTKINAAGSALVYSSYLGGSEDDYGRGIAVDSAGNAYLAGRASSVDFPTVNQIPGACPQQSCSAFVAKIDTSGTALVYSSRFGGSSGNGQAHAIAVDNSGSAYVTGETESTDFPLVNPILYACRGSCGSGTNLDGFVTKINASGHAFVYSSYIGGSGDDNGGSFVCNSSIAVDSLHYAYLSGCTLSADFPLVPRSIPGACKGSCGTGGNIDAFVTKISP